MKNLIALTSTHRMSATAAIEALCDPASTDPAGIPSSNAEAAKDRRPTIPSVHAVTSADREPPDESDS